MPRPTTALAACLALALVGCESSPAAPFPGIAGTGQTDGALVASYRVGDDVLAAKSGSILTWRHVGDSFTFAVPVCAGGGHRLTVTAVEPGGSIGTGYRFVGYRVVDYRLGSEGLISAEGYPQSVTTVRAILAMGDPVRACLDGFDPEAVSTRIEIGLAATGPAGGGWKGVQVHYREGTDARVLRVDTELTLCGDATRRC